MKQFFQQDRLLVGLLAGLGSEVLTALLLWVALLVVGLQVDEHVRWFGIAFVPPVLLLRYYAHLKKCPLVTKTLIITVFVSFVVFMFYLLKTKALVW